MHFLTKISIPNEAGNKFISSKDFNQKMDGLISNLKPEATYFCVENGVRTIFAFVNIENSYEIPAKAEPFWLAMSANVEFIPAMNAQDFSKAAAGIKQSVEKYAHP
ncbi:hypothetical protein [Bdellovibrio svalbardensis]|uniref:Panthothenate synthetase n=1 Tax=Bdellovibrio svalbardensis TaxID=2972972 RepID=A0ABT6DI13_9BACT|nr:hypothetical protein [Bdellovibrio svalbardensis]MDG0816502.1 hypothetical protein [Bdellovibrio svalbardensis]